MYTDEKMKLRADCFRALQHHLDENCRDVYEFCHQWILGGNTDIEDVEISFLDMLALPPPSADDFFLPAA